MWAILGDIEFELVGSPIGMEHHFAAEFAEHALISKKPRLEAVAIALDELSLDIKLHHTMGNVEERVRQIREAVAAQNPLALVMGDGDYRGPWVVTDGVVTAQKTTEGGRLLSAMLKLTLREYGGEFTRPVATPGILRGASLPGALGSVAAIASPLQQVVGYARAADNAIRGVNTLIRGAWDMGRNPLAALQQLPGIARAAGQALQSVQGLQSAAAVLSNLTKLALLGSSLSMDLIAARAALRRPHASTVLDQLQRASGFVSGGLQRLDEARPTIAKLAASVITRQS